MIVIAADHSASQMSVVAASDPCANAHKTFTLGRVTRFVAPRMRGPREKHLFFLRHV